MSSWVARTSNIRDLLAASTGEVGLVGGGLSMGSMVGVMSSSPFITRFGARRVVLAGIATRAASLPMVGLGTMVGPGQTAAAPVLFALGMDAAEIAVNVEGALVESTRACPLLPFLHGCHSVGTVASSGLGLTVAAVDVPEQVELVIVGTMIMAVLVSTVRVVSIDGGRRPSAVGGDVAEERAPALKRGRLLLIGLLALASAEGTANDWLPLLVVDLLGLRPVDGSRAVTIFAVTTTVGRFSGSALFSRFGRAPVLRISAVAAASGIVLVSFGHGQVALLAAVVLWGAGASLAFPIVISAAGSSGQDSAAPVALVPTVGCMAFLVGPPLLGVLDEHFGLAKAMLVPLGAVITAFFLAPAVRSRRPQDISEHGSPPAPLNG
ncbi:MFS transporter [Kineococcus aurantiacus]